MAEERWVIIYWDTERKAWQLDHCGQFTDEIEAREYRDLYRHELGNGRVRMIHTADGS